MGCFLQRKGTVFISPAVMVNECGFPGECQDRMDAFNFKFPMNSADFRRSFSARSAKKSAVICAPHSLMSFHACSK